MSHQCRGCMLCRAALTSRLPFAGGVVEQVVDIAAAVQDAHQLVPGGLHAYIQFQFSGAV